MDDMLHDFRNHLHSRPLRANSPTDVSTAGIRKYINDIKLTKEHKKVHDAILHDLMATHATLAEEDQEEIVELLTSWGLPTRLTANITNTNAVRVIAIAKFLAHSE